MDRFLLNNLKSLFLAVFISLSLGNWVSLSQAETARQEDGIDLPKELPDPKNLKSFTTSVGSPLKFALDSKSISIGNDRVIRYIVVITNPSGTKQVKYEGIRCESFEYKVYAVLNEENQWRTFPNSEWKRIPNLGYNQYQATLGRSGLCAGDSPNSNFKEIFENLR